MNVTQLGKFVSNVTISSAHADLPGFLLSGKWVLAICISPLAKLVKEAKEIFQISQGLILASGSPV